MMSYDPGPKIFDTGRLPNSPLLRSKSNSELDATARSVSAKGFREADLRSAPAEKRECHVAGWHLTFTKEYR